MSRDGLRTLAAELSSRSDEQLVDFLVRRPDLATPPPRGTAVLADRAMAAGSIRAASGALDLLAVAVVEAFLAAAAEHPTRGRLGPVTRDQIVTRLGRRALRADVDRRLRLLSDLALIWPADEEAKPTSWVSIKHLAAALPWQASHLLGPVATLAPDEIASRIDALDERPRELLGALADGPALGRSQDARPDADPTTPVARLLAAGLIDRVDEQTVELSPQVGQVLRGEPPLPTASLREPTAADHAPESRFDAATIDAAGAGQALEALRHVDDLVDVLGAAPAAALKSGGLGVRELRRIAKSSGLPLPRAGFLLDVLVDARLIDAGSPHGGYAPESDRVFAPTAAVDGWARQDPAKRWATLVTTWLRMPRRPWQIGETDRDGNTIGVAGNTYDHSAWWLREQVLTALADVSEPVPATADDIVTVIGWRHPRSLRSVTRRAVTETVREATDLGLIAHGAITDVGRCALRVTDDDVTDLVGAMEAALPEPIDYFLVQADLTVTVPGPLTYALAERLSLVADLESGGAASVYRVTEDGIRRALDAGHTAAELSSLFTEHSKTPVPQSLTYLIDDVARRHGSLRVGVASSFVRCDDPATMTAVLRNDAAADLSLRALAPTVAVSPAPLSQVVDRLRSAGFAPAGEDSTGALVDLRQAGVRLESRERSRRPDPSRRIGRGQAESVVTRMRAADRADGAVASSASSTGGGESTTTLVQLALQTGRRLRIGYVDAQGGASRHVVRPTALAAGQLIAEDEVTRDELRFALHRVTRVELL